MKTRWQHGLFPGRPGESPHATGGFGRSDALGILLANLAVLGLSLWQGLPAACLVWPYWCQSAVIGLFHHRRILALQRFSTEGFTSNDRPVPVTEQAKRETALFFALHYGFFHAMFLLFLAALAWPATADWNSGARAVTSCSPSSDDNRWAASASRPMDSQLILGASAVSWAAAASTSVWGASAGTRTATCLRVIISAPPPSR